MTRYTRRADGPGWLIDDMLPEKVLSPPDLATWNAVEIAIATVKDEERQRREALERAHDLEMTQAVEEANRALRDQVARRVAKERPWRQRGATEGNATRRQKEAPLNKWIWQNATEMRRRRPDLSLHALATHIVERAARDQVEMPGGSSCASTLATTGLQIIGFGLQKVGRTLTVRTNACARIGASITPRCPWPAILPSRLTMMTICRARWRSTTTGA